MRLISVLSLIVTLALASSVFAARQSGEKTPPKAPTEQIYLESDVNFDLIEQTASDQDGIPLTGIVQSFYPNGRLSWETRWVVGKLHGVTRGYYENRKLKEETTWENGKLNGPARWYDEKGELLQETMYEENTDLSAPDDRGEDKNQPAGEADAPKEAAPTGEAVPATQAAPATDGKGAEAERK
jgi:hypothetical protein